MTYQEFCRVYFGAGVTDTLRKSLLDNQPVEFRAAWVALRALEDRGGFDGWWDGIDEETQDEIFESLITAIKSVQGIKK